MNLHNAITYLSGIFNFIKNYYHYFINIIFGLIMFILVYLAIWVISLIINILRLLPKLNFFNKSSAITHYHLSKPNLNNNDLQNKISPPRGIFFSSFIIFILFIILLMISFFFIKRFNFAPITKILGLSDFSKNKLHQLTALPNNSSDNMFVFRQKSVKELDKLDAILKSKDYHPVALESEQKQLLKELGDLKSQIIATSDMSETQITNNITELKQKIDKLNHKYGKILMNSADVLMLRQKSVKELDKLDAILKSKDYHPVALESEQKQLLKELGDLKSQIIATSDMSETQITNNITELKQKIDKLNHKYGKILMNSADVLMLRQKSVKELDKLDAILKSKDYHPVALESEQKQLLKELGYLKSQIIATSDMSETQITNNITELKQKIDKLNHKYGEIIMNKLINSNNFKQNLPNVWVVPVPVLTVN
ncbi:MAG: hypothetical protein Q8897_00405 [Sweet potato little leaf phytoplasma]|uniref:coiled-coil domain-containing protein n=6 Tax=Candidatus Phytoplasma australasiaticum TaxID=2754999 RepID=UPI0027140A25|nr:hypothetical protein [Sweet potato little leaf phytoplasma]MDO8005249.1 hypothetical protein [Sweet potato little leaf phytoplasma]MDO8020221.1 hypothetical protein [Sweet potato little leaf phytoplasma]MDV3139657.1 hypothetical protein [Sweet potato little leaf phytoplasma]MDV3142884.1 hypothetical protein [Sweet potato little leaf phytoplasma]MDV3146290.1 hypothetical protein [Sweet potato little leaf phytoplasma]